MHACINAKTHYGRAMSNCRSDRTLETWTVLTKFGGWFLINLGARRSSFIEKFSHLAVILSLQVPPFIYLFFTYHLSFSRSKCRVFCLYKRTTDIKNRKSPFIGVSQLTKVKSPSVCSFAYMQIKNYGFHLSSFCPHVPPLQSLNRSGPNF